MQKLFCFIFCCWGSVHADTSLVQNFTGTVDSKAKIKCFLKPDDATNLTARKFSCRFQPGYTFFTAIGHSDLNSRYKCLIQKDGNTDICISTAGYIGASKKKFFIYSSASSTGLISCLTTTENDQLDDLLCSENTNPEAGVFGTDNGRKNFASCLIDESYLLMIDELTRDHDELKTGDYVVQVSDINTRMAKKTFKANFQNENTNGDPKDPFFIFAETDTNNNFLILISQKRKSYRESFLQTKDSSARPIDCILASESL